MPLSEKASELGERPLNSVLTKNGDISVLTLGIDIRTAIAKEFALKIVSLDETSVHSYSERLPMRMAKAAVEFTDALLEELAK